MVIYKLLDELGYKKFDEFSFENIVLSKLYKSENKLIIIDQPEIFTTNFTYKLYCQTQNEWIQEFESVYRFIYDDLDMFKLFLIEEERDYKTANTFNREVLTPDPSVLESTFETCFQQAYGSKAFSALRREYAFQMRNGETGYIDYALFSNKDESWIAIEENGVSFHHPKIIGKEKYRKILNKQNSVISTNGIIYRWDTESIRNTERIIDEIKEFLGNTNQYIAHYRITEERGFHLYEHQEEYITELKTLKSKEKNTALVVLPTGTGKTHIAIESLKEYKYDEYNKETLILVPSIELREQWRMVLKSQLNDISAITIYTYAKASNQYIHDDFNKYTHLIVDEAHHAVAPVLRKVIQHYNVELLLGLTATDQRLDEKKLSDVFGKYQSKLTLEEAIKQSILCPIRGYRLESNINLTKVTFNGTDYNSSQLEKHIRVPSRNQLIADTIYKYFYDRLKGKSGLIFCINVKHAKEIAILLREKGFSAESVDGKDPKRHDKVKGYMEKTIQFLCTCSLLTEGWDAPHTSIIVMARPTLSKVLYQQQLGRGTRRYKGKEALYVIDVVDTYGTFGTVSNRAWSLHSLFENPFYKPFDNVVKVNGPNDEIVLLDTIHEKEIKLDPFDIFTFEKLYGDYISTEQMARELFVSTGTLNNWIRKGQISPDLTIPVGRGKLHMFTQESIETIRIKKGLKIHNEDTIVEDFWEFINKGDYTYSYKMYFILALLDTVDETGDANVNDLLIQYRAYYLKRHENKVKIDRPGCPYENLEYLNDDKKLKTSMLNNPFEKFERKRFLYHAKDKDLNKISIHHKLWNELNSNDNSTKLRKKMKEDIKTYYSSLQA